MIVESYEDVIILSGALRHNFWETIHTAISLTLKRHPTGVIIDCGGITECTAKGAETFLDAMEFIEQLDARIIVAAVPAHVLEVLKSVPGVRSQLPIAPTVDAARRSLDLLTEEPTKRTAPSKVCDCRFLVCLFGEDVDREVLNTAWQLANDRNAEVHLIYVILVPRDLPIQSPLAESETKGAAAIERGKQFMRDHEIPYRTHIERSRDLAASLAESQVEIDAQTVLVPIRNDLTEFDATARTIKSILTKVASPVLFVRGPAPK